MTTLRCCSVAATPASSAAKLFVQLSCARHGGGSAATFSTSTSPSTPAFSILDVLLPPAAPRPFHRHLSSSRSSSTDGGGSGRGRGYDVPGLTPSRHAASASASASAPTRTRARPTPRFQNNSHGTTAAAATYTFPPTPTPTRRHGSALASFFSTTAARRETRAIHNPQRDEDGNEMVLEITPRAANVR